MGWRQTPLTIVTLLALRPTACRRLKPKEFFTMATKKPIAPLTRNGVTLTDADWKAGLIDPSMLPDELATKYLVLRAAQAEAATQVAVFSAAVTAALGGKLPKTQRLVVSHRFGRLTILNVDKPATKVAAAGSVAAMLIKA
jgi:hypothetical protein